MEYRHGTFIKLTGSDECWIGKAAIVAHFTEPAWNVGKLEKIKYLLVTDMVLTTVN
jgi:hypothetical protein